MCIYLVFPSSLVPSGNHQPAFHHALSQKLILLAGSHLNPFYFNSSSPCVFSRRPGDGQQRVISQKPPSRWLTGREELPAGSGPRRRGSTAEARPGRFLPEAGHTAALTEPPAPRHPAGPTSHPIAPTPHSTEGPELDVSPPPRRVLLTWCGHKIPLLTKYSHRAFFWCYPPPTKHTGAG